MCLFSFLLQLHTHEVVEVCAKILYQVELNRGNLDTMWGFSVEAELVENSDKQDELCCYVSRVEERSVAMTNGESETGGRGKFLVWHGKVQTAEIYFFGVRIYRDYVLYVQTFLSNSPPAKRVIKQQ